MVITDLPTTALDFLKERLGPEDYEDFKRLLAEDHAVIPAGAAILDSPVSILGDISVRLWNVLFNEDIYTLKDLTVHEFERYRQMLENEHQAGRKDLPFSLEHALLHTPNMGKRSVQELEQALARVGWTFEALNKVRQASWSR